RAPGVVPRPGGAPSRPGGWAGPCTREPGCPGRRWRSPGPPRSWPGPAGSPAGQPIAEVLTAPDATTLTARVTTGGHATVVMSARDRMLVFTAAGLRTLPASQCYELWLLEPGR